MTDQDQSTRKPHNQADEMGENDPASPYYNPFGIERQNLYQEIGRLRQALTDIMVWRDRVNDDPQSVMCGLENDPEGIAVALFNGPIWDAARIIWQERQP